MSWLEDFERLHSIVTCGGHVGKSDRVNYLKMIHKYGRELIDAAKIVDKSCALSVQFGIDLDKSKVLLTHVDSVLKVIEEAAFVNGDPMNHMQARSMASSLRSELEEGKPAVYP